MEPWEQNGEELIDGSGRNVTQQRIDGEAGFEAEDEDVVFEPDAEWLEGGDPEATAS
jgi:hypothetical protein